MPILNDFMSDVKPILNPHENHQRGLVYKGQQSIPKKKYRQIQSATYLG